jgi:hypothetical protein
MKESKIKENRTIKQPSLPFAKGNLGLKHFLIPSQNPLTPAYGHSRNPHPAGLQACDCSITTNCFYLKLIQDTDLHVSL